MRHWNDQAAPMQYLWDTTIFGGKAFQTWADLFIWEKFLNISGAKSLIELGSGEGHFSLWLGCQCCQRNMSFLTVDEKPPEVTESYLVQAMTVWWQFRQFDIFQNIPLIQNYITKYPKPLILLCDNGDKIREFTTFAPMLSPGDYVVVHDWGSEIRPVDIAPLEHLFTNVPELSTILQQVQTFSLWLKRT